MQLTRTRALNIGIAAIACILLLQAWIGFGCYRQDFGMFVTGVLYFLLIPLLPAALSLFRHNPLGAVGACLLITPWMLFAWYTDCVKPYMGGGASLAYVSVILYGTPCAIIGALLTPWLTQKTGLEVID
jgi:type IV secretory pathway TrbD component